MITKRLYTSSDELERFLAAAALRGFENNSNLDVMKWDWCIDVGGAWFGTYDASGSMVSISGIHPFEDGYRALFRGAQLESRPIGINKYHMQSYCFHSQLPYQIQFSKRYRPIYITTNPSNDASGMMIRIDKTFELLERLDMVKFVGKSDIFAVPQNVWQLNVDRYTEIRARF